MSVQDMGLKKIIDMTRGISILLLLLHFYYYWYGVFREWGYVSAISDRILLNIAHTGLFNNVHQSKAIALGFLLLSLIGIKGRKGEKYRVKTGLIYLLAGVLFFFGSSFVVYLLTDKVLVAVLYMATTGLGFILVLTGGSILSRIIHIRLNGDVFNKANETFPQEEGLLTNEFSINLPTRFNYQGRVRSGHINIINPFRGTLVLGSPGSGKTYFVIQHFIRQHIGKGFAMFIYDYKYPDLTLLAYNLYLKHAASYPVKPRFYSICFDDPSSSSCCSCFDILSMHDVTDAAESARTMMLALNPDWAEKQGDFWVESSVNFLTALIWFLRKYEDGKYCTLPHVIELAQQPYDKLFSVLRYQPEVDSLIASFVNAFLNDARNQLEGQIASTTIALSRLASPQLYYLLSRNDFRPDIADPAAPQIVCIGNNPQKSGVYGPVISLYLTLVTRLLNKKGNRKSALVIDELPTLYFNGIASFMATVRSNKVATTLGVQNVEQLNLAYGEKAGKMIFNMAGNLICGQTKGEAARHLSEGFGKILQNKQSISESEQVSVTRSKSLDYAIPQATVSSLSAGEFVGIVADNPDQEIQLKLFHGKIVNEHQRLEREVASFQSLPRVREVGADHVSENYLRIKREVEDLVQVVLEKMIKTPELSGKLVRR